MKKEYEEAFSEVDKIFDLMPIELLNKIPIKFKELIKENRSTLYKPNINEPFEDCKLKDETLVILALIYRDFLCSAQEKQQLLLRDSNKIKEFENELRKKYNPDDIFKNKRNIQEPLENTTTAIVEYKEKNFIQKLFDKIKNIFKKK